MAISSTVGEFSVGAKMVHCQNSLPSAHLGDYRWQRGVLCDPSSDTPPDQLSTLQWDSKGQTV